MNESEALSQHSVHVRCLRSDLILAAWLGRASLSDRLYPPPGSGAPVQLPSADLTVCSVHPNDTHAGLWPNQTPPQKAAEALQIREQAAVNHLAKEVVGSEVPELE